MLGIAGGLAQHLVGDLGVELGPAAPQDGDHPVRGIGARGVAPADLPAPALALGIHVGDGEPLQVALGPEQVYRAPVGQHGHAQAREGAEGGLVIERGAQRGARAGQKAKAVLEDGGLGCVHGGAPGNGRSGVF